MCKRAGSSTRRLAAVGTSLENRLVIGDVTLQPLRLQRRTANDLYVWHAADGDRLVKLFRGKHASARCECERAALALWHTRGFPVPPPDPQGVPGLETPHLVRAMLPGDSLRDVLRQPRDNIAGKVDLIEHVYRQIRQRHELALFTGDSRWIHPDANTGNIVATRDTPIRTIWIDIETQARDVNPVDAAADEVAKFTLCAANDMGREHLDAICARWIAVYRGLEFVPRRFCRKTDERRFQRIHLWRDRRRKLATPALVTKYDLADCLRSALAAKLAAA